MQLSIKVLHMLGHTLLQGSDLGGVVRVCKSCYIKSGRESERARERGERQFDR